MDETWQRARFALTLAFFGLGVALTAYVAVSITGAIRNASEHYALFVLVILILSGMLGMRNGIDSRLNGRPAKRYWPMIVTSAVGLVVAATGAGYVLVNAVRIEMILPFYEPIDMAMGLVLIVGVMLLSLIHWGPLLTGMVVLSIVYFFYGYHLESPLLMIPEYDREFVMNYVALGTGQGFYWLSQVAVDSIYFLLFYASILLAIGMLPTVLEVGKWSGRHIDGGAAFPAIIGSGIVASVIGQAVANVVLTGRFTIPMMKERNFSPSMAGAIEAVASTSGQLMPPLLGLAGFIIASFLNMPYIDVALGSLIPALLFLSAIAIGVIVYARANNLPRLDMEIDKELIFRIMPATAISFLVVLGLLLFYFSPSMAGVFGTVIALILCLFQGKYRPTWKTMFNSIDDGLVLITILSLLTIAVGPLAQMVITTNLSGKLASFLVAYLPDIKLLMLFVAMIVALAMGMGLPTPVAYVVVALVLAPFLQELGAPALQAHFFVFYFAVFSTLTPPIAVGVLAAAKLANANLLATARDSLKLAITTFIIPFGFVYHPEIMSFPHLTWSVLPPVITLLVLQWTTAVACFGYFTRPLTAIERWGFGLVCVLGFFAVIAPGITLPLIFSGLVLAAAIWVKLAANWSAEAARLKALAEERRT